MYFCLYHQKIMVNVECIKKEGSAAIWISPLNKYSSAVLSYFFKPISLNLSSRYSPAVMSS
jgi:hypothetical protein